MSTTPTPERYAQAPDSRRCDAVVKIENLVYEATIHFFESREGTQLRGNGHHMAQQLAAQAGALVLERWIGADVGEPT